MPAPQVNQIQMALTQAFIAKGFTKKTYVDGKLIEDRTALPDQLANLVAALATGDQAWFAQWQAAQVVQILNTGTPGGPSVAPAGTGLP